MTSTPRPLVSLIGTGPGDPELLTVKALRAIECADIAVYDRLVAEPILDLVPRGVSRIFAGKQCRNHFMTQDEINALLVRLGRQGKRVARLKGGDPYTFGRGVEEALALADAGVPFEVIPGITSASGCAAAAGIPLTHRGLATGVRYLTGHGQEGQPLDADWASLADPSTTLVIYMGLTHAREIAMRLIEAGMPSYLPAAAVENGSRPDQRTLTASLATLADRLDHAGFRSPTLLIIGRVAALAHALASAEPAPSKEMAHG